MPRGRTLSLRGLSFGPSKRNISQGPPSPSLSEATNVSAINFGANVGPSKIITRANLKASMQAYEDLVNCCATYRAALITMSKATAGFADAMERCSSLKGPSYEAGSRLQAASGVHHLIGNLWHVLSDTLDNTFEKPMRQHLHEYRTVVNDRSQKYERTLREKSHAIHETENRSMNKKERNLQNFRQALAVLQRQVDELDELKVSHYQEIVDHEEEVWEAVQSKICVVVRSEMDIFDRITSKSSDPIIEPMLQSVPDPFDSYGPPPSEDQIFSILAPLSMTTPTPSTSAGSLTSPLVSTLPECDPMDSAPTSANTKIASWLPDAQFAEWTSTPSPSLTPPRSVSPPTSRPTSPTNRPGSRRHSSPLVQQYKQESNLRSMLSVVDEAKPNNERPLGPSPLPALMTNLNTPRPRSDTDVGDNFAYGEAASEGGGIDHDEGGQLTPKNSTLFCRPDLPQEESELAQDQVSIAPSLPEEQLVPKLSVIL